MKTKFQDLIEAVGGIQDTSPVSPFDNKNVGDVVSDPHNSRISSLLMKV